jgi:hypothetical protein
VPLAVIDEDYLEIFDEEVPLAGLPKMGDSSLSPKGLLGTMAMSFLGAVGIIKRRKDEI